MEIQEINRNAKTIGEMVAQDYRKASIFKKYGLDFCCGGNKTLDKVCAEKGIDLIEITEALNTVDHSTLTSTTDFNTLELDALIDHIISTHHKYVAETIPLLTEFSQKVAKVHGAANPEVVEIYQYYQTVAAELALHMQKEELMLFPNIRRMVLANRSGEQFAPQPFGTIANPIHSMEAEHESAGEAMQSIRDLSNNYTPPAHACNTYRVLYSKLEEFENDLHQHVHLENNILFPKAILLEQEF